jgi:hypothetical protein
MATVKKSMKSAAKKMKPVAPARKGAKPSLMMQSPMTAAPMMKKGGKMKKAQDGAHEAVHGKSSTKKPSQVSIPSKFAPKGVDTKIKDAYNTPSKPTLTGKKAKSGGSFPDLNKDGKVTRADILKGRGVIAKKGASVSKKCKYGCK